MRIAATLTLDDAAVRPWDAVVAGAGPAGSLVARQLALRGFSVLLVDRAAFPRFRVCGCCLNAGALETLRSVGLGGLARACGAVQLSEVCLAACGRSARLWLPGSVSLSRETFDTALLGSAISAGVAFLSRTTARSLVEKDGGRVRHVALRAGEQERAAEARLLLAADGLGGRVLADEPDCDSPSDPASRIGAGAVAAEAPAFFAAGTIYMACGDGGYVGLVRLEDGRLDVAAALDPWLVRKRDGVAGAVAAILECTDWPPLPCLAELPWRGTPALTRRRRRLAGPGFFVLGDAAGYVEPFTGEGMAWALASAAALAPLAADCLLRPAGGGRWPGLHRRLLGPRQRLCRVVARCLRHPRLIAGLVGVLRWAPFLAAPLVRRLCR